MINNYNTISDKNKAEKLKKEILRRLESDIKLYEIILKMDSASKIIFVAEALNLIYNNDFIEALKVKLSLLKIK